MNRAFRTTCLTIAAGALLTIAGAANARGCVSGAAVGGVAGHVAGKHAVLGAVAGCAINHHRDKVADRKTAAAAQQQSQAPSQGAVQPSPAPH